MRIYVNARGQVVDIKENTFVANASGETNEIVFFFVDDNNEIIHNTNISYGNLAVKRSDGFPIGDLLLVPTEIAEGWCWKYTIIESDGVLYRNGQLSVSAKFVHATYDESNNITKRETVATVAVTAHVQTNIGLADEDTFNETLENAQLDRDTLQGEITVNANDIAQLKTDVGVKTNLTTDDKSNLVAAINEVDGHVNTNTSGLSAEIVNRTAADNALSDRIDTCESNSAAAVSAANTANEKADNAVSTANGANTKSNTAISTANTASGTANNALLIANGIDTKATQALSKSNSAISTANDAKAIAEGANHSYTADNLSAIVTAFNGFDDSEYKVGDNVYNRTVDKPDLWVSSVEDTSVQYEYTTDDAFVNSLDTDGYVQVGYYKLSRLETGKVALDDYYTKTETDELVEGAKIKQQLDFEGTLSGGVLTFTPTTPYELENNVEYEIDLLFSAVGTIPDDTEIVISNNSQNIVLNNVLNLNSAVNVTFAQMKQVMNYDTETGYRWIFDATYNSVEGEVSIRVFNMSTAVVTPRTDVVQIVSNSDMLDAVTNGVWNGSAIVTPNDDDGYAKGHTYQWNNSDWTDITPPSGAIGTKLSGSLPTSGWSTVGAFWHGDIRTSTASNEKIGSLPQDVINTLSSLQSFSPITSVGTGSYSYNHSTSYSTNSTFSYNSKSSTVITWRSSAVGPSGSGLQISIYLQASGEAAAGDIWVRGYSDSSGKNFSYTLKSLSCVSIAGTPIYTISKSAIKVNSFVQLFLSDSLGIREDSKTDGSVIVIRDVVPTVAIPYTMQVIDTTDEGAFEVINSYVPEVPSNMPVTATKLVGSLPITGWTADVDTAMFLNRNITGVGMPNAIFDNKLIVIESGRSITVTSNGHTITISGEVIDMSGVPSIQFSYGDSEASGLLFIATNYGGQSLLVAMGLGTDYTFPVTITASNISSESNGYSYEISNAAIKTNSTVQMYLEDEGGVKPYSKADGSVVVVRDSVPTTAIDYNLQVVETSAEGVFEIVNAYVPDNHYKVLYDNATGAASVTTSEALAQGDVVKIQLNSISNASMNITAVVGESGLSGVSATTEITNSVAIATLMIATLSVSGTTVAVSAVTQAIISTGVATTDYTADWYITNITKIG